VRGVEFDGTYQGDAFSLYAALAYTDGEYTSFANAPLPLELTGAPFTSVDATGGRLPGISKWSGSVGGEYHRPASFLGTDGEIFTALDVFYRDDFSSSATPSQYLNIPGYALTNARLGFRSDSGWVTYLWVRNAFDKDYFELLQAAPAGQGAGHYGAQLGDPRTYGITLRYAF
jgi:Outer membrane receptor proteins, mostly Fe transport